MGSGPDEVRTSKQTIRRFDASEEMQMERPIQFWKLIPLGGILAGALAGQTPAPPAGSPHPAASTVEVPSGTEEAVRERASEFYRLQIEGKFRQAEALVCEESKDVYYDAEKERWKSLKIQGVTFTAPQAARVSVALGNEMKTPQGTFPVEVPMVSVWHEKQGQWCLSMPKPGTGEKITPWGVMKAGPGGTGKLPTAKPVSVGSIQSGVQLSKKVIRFDPATPSSDVVTISNRLDGSIQIEVNTVPLNGLTWKVVSPMVKSQGSTQLEVSYDPSKAVGQPASRKLMVTIHPINLVQDVAVEFQKK